MKNATNFQLKENFFYDRCLFVLWIFLNSKRFRRNKGFIWKMLTEINCWKPWVIFDILWIWNLYVTCYCLEIFLDRKNICHNKFQQFLAIFCQMVFSVGSKLNQGRIYLKTSTAWGHQNREQGLRSHLNKF